MDKIKVVKSVPFHLDRESCINYVNVYNNYDEFSNVMKYYAPTITDEELNSIIYTTTKDGFVIAFDNNCYRMIEYIKNRESLGSIKNIIL